MGTVHVKVKIPFDFDYASKCQIEKTPALFLFCIRDLFHHMAQISHGEFRNPFYLLTIIPTTDQMNCQINSKIYCNSFMVVI